MIAVVCQANYCRSPVAKFLLQKYLHNIEIDSFGISYFPQATMDPRSIEYLESKGFSDLYHIPKKINKSHIKNIDLILMMDMKVLEYFRQFHSNDLNKCKLFTFLDPKKSIIDPFKFDNIEDYFREMDKIDDFCKLWSEHLN
jgi:protein-tyrosine phosphatase